MPENTKLLVDSVHKDILSTNITEIEVSNSTGPQKWPITLFGRDAGHDVLKVDTTLASLKYEPILLVIINFIIPNNIIN